MLTKHIFEFHNEIPISINAIKGHIALYEKYVDEANTIVKKLQSGNFEPAEKQEMMRRFSFEYSGAKNHEYFFETLTGNTSPLNPSSLLYEAIVLTWGSYDAWKEEFMTLSKTRGVGWAILWHDAKTNSLFNSWVDEQHIGQLVGADHILGIDCWEHSFILDFGITGRAAYVEKIFSALNFGIIEKRFK